MKKTSKLDVNGIAVCDRAIQNVKGRIAEILAKTKREWTTALRTATDQYNSDFHSTVRDAPEEVATNPTLKFMTMKDNAAKSSITTSCWRSARTC